MKDVIEDVVNNLRKFAESDKKGEFCLLNKVSAIRIVDYIDKLEDENLLLRTIENRQININLKGK